MDLVTLTDHDCVTGALRLAGRPDTFVSEEVTCALPEGRQLHLGVYDLSEGQHEGIAARRGDAERLFAYLAEQRLPVALNHPFSALTGARLTSDLTAAFAHVTHVEGRNGMLPPVTNRAASEAAMARGLPIVGGSDSHTLRSVARAYTVVPGARNRAEFLAGLRHGFTVPAGRSGTYARLTGDLVHIAAGAYARALREAFSSLTAAASALALLAAVPLLPLLPAVSAVIAAHERRFAARHFALFGITPMVRGRRTVVARRGYRPPALAAS